VVSQLRREFLPEVGGSNFGNGQAARGDHDLVRADEAPIRVDLKAQGSGS
jgi:hypothetical protein